MHFKLLSQIISLVLVTGSFSAGEPFAHPGVLNTFKRLRFMKRKVKAGQIPWSAAWDSLRTWQSSYYEFTPESITHVVRGPYSKPSVGDRQLSAAARAAHSHAFQWVITDNRARATNTIGISSRWFSLLWTFQDNDT
ncbi:MAG: hypothetical protein VX910_07370 [Candidatus Latescibacterota bacterium]|nr:hypothetical protein [Candidatus Latescibacterota bacterium]